MTKQLKGKGAGLLDSFEPKNIKSPVELIRFSAPELTLPKYFVKQMADTKTGQRKFKLTVPTTKTHNLTTRNKLKSIYLKCASIDKIEIEPFESIVPTPTLNEFSKKDQQNIINMYDEMKPKHNTPEEVQIQKLVRGKTTLPIDEAIKRKIESKKASAKRIYQAKKLEGSGLFQTIYKAKKAIKKAVVSGEKFVEALLDTDQAYPPNVKQIKDEHGDDVITRLILRRNSVSSLITGLMNVVSLGSFYKKLGREPYDKLFHLALLVVTANGGFLLEKIERVNVSKDLKLQKGTEELEVNNIPANLTVRELIENTEKEMGNNFLPYNPATNNCQNFILNVLKANGLLNPTYETWIKQDTQALFAKDPFLLSLSNKLIDIGKITNVISQGGNLLSNDNIQMLHHRIPHSANLINLQLHNVMSQIPEALEAGKSVHGEGIGRFVHGIVKKVSHGVSDVVDTVAPVVNTVQDVIKVANQVGAMPGQVSSAVGDAMHPDNLANAGHEIAQILYRRGLPMTASTLGFIAGTALTGSPVGGIALGTAASYGTSRAVNEYQPKGLGLFAGHSGGNGLYGGNGIGLASPPPMGMKPRSTTKRIKIPMDDMSGGTLLIDRKVSLRGLAHSINDIPKTVTKTANQLAGAGLKKSRMVKGSDAAKAWGLKMRAMRKKK